MPSLHPKDSFVPRAVVFDLDGTLVEFKFDVLASRRAMINWLREEGFDVSSMNEKTRTLRIIEEAQNQWEAKGSSAREFESIKNRLSDILDGFEFDAFREAKPHPGSLGLLRSLSDRSFLTAIVTNSGRKPVNSILDVFGFSKFIRFVITRNEVSSLKPNPEGINKALLALGVKAEEAIYVGDSTIDVEAARASGVKSVAVTCGMYGPRMLVPSNPDYLAQNIEDVEGIFSESF